MTTATKIIDSLVFDLENMTSSSTAELKSWINVPKGSHFPIQNLPYGVFIKNTSDEKHIGVAIGDQILDLYAVTKAGFFGNAKYLPNSGSCFLESTLNSFMSLDRNAWMEARVIIQDLLLFTTNEIQDCKALYKQCVVAQSSVDMCLPCTIGDYSDFYSSRNHARNVGIMFRGPKNALQPNWSHLPVGYHGRASSVVVSGTPVRRPCGQTRNNAEQPPIYEACQKLDFELEVGFFYGGSSNKLGNPILMEDTFDHIFGMVLLNDWSARDIQKWEYVPLGPFNAKNFCTSISPWIITMEALKPFRLPLCKQQPPLLPYLVTKKDFVLDINLLVSIQSSNMKEPQILSESNTKYLYYSAQQQLAHHSSTGCPFLAGDLLGSGTISGTNKNELGCLLEMSWAGKYAIPLDDGTARKYLHDGDTIVLNGRAVSQDGSFCIGFGGVSGTILPAHDPTLLGKL